MSVAEPPKKKQKTDNLPKYNFVDNGSLALDSSHEIVMDETYFAKSTQSLYTLGCSTCVALILVVRLSNDTIMHGLNHSSIITDDESMVREFNILKKSIEGRVNGKSDVKIVDTDYYLVGSPQYKEYYTNIIKKISQNVNIYFSNCIREQHNPEINVDGDVGCVNVKVSIDLIEVEYDATG